MKKVNKKVLLCPPDYYDIEYEINPWMDVQNKVDRKKARDEYNQLKETYKNLGCEVLELAQEKGLPDMVYAANWGFPKGEIFIRSNFKFPQRRKEAELAQKFLENLGYKIDLLPDGIFFEGQGDLLAVGDKYFLGWGKRSDPRVIKYLKKQLGENLLDFELHDPYFYHLDMSLAPLDHNTVVINPKSFKKEDLKKIHQSFKNVIKTDERDNKTMACNLVMVNNTIVIGEGISDNLKKKFYKHGFDFKEIPMGEFRKGGGSVKCLTLEFF